MICTVDDTEAGPSVWIRFENGSVFLDLDRLRKLLEKDGTYRVTMDLALGQESFLKSIELMRIEPLDFERFP